MTTESIKIFVVSCISTLYVVYFSLRYRGRVSFGKNIRINHRFRIQGKGKVIIEDSCNLWAHQEYNRFYFYGDKGRILIQEGSRINGVFCHIESSISIGKNCLVGSSTLMDTNFHTFSHPEHPLLHSQKTLPIVIHDNCWIGGQSTVLKGVTLQEMCVVGFRSVVAKSFPEKSIIVGNPGKALKKDSV